MKHFLLLLLVFVPLYLASAQNVNDIDLLIWDARYDDAINLIEKELGIANTHTAILKNKKGEAYIRLGKFDEAHQVLQEALTLSTERKSKSDQGISLTNLGLLHLNKGRNDLALETLQKALNLFEEDGKSVTLASAQALAYLGILYNATGKYTQAEEQLIIALSYRQKLLPENHELIAASYNDLGLVYTQTNEDKALEYYEKAFTMYEKLHGNSHPKIAITNTNIGYIYNKLELYGDAINNFESALATWQKVYTHPHPSKAFILFSLGQTYQKMKDEKRAREYYEQALSIYEGSYGTKHPEIARVLNALGNLHLASFKFEEGLSYYQKALQANVGDFSINHIQVNPSANNFYDGNVLLYTLLYKAQAMESRHYNKTLKFKDLALAIQTLQLCDTLIERLRQQITNENDKITLGIIANEVYGDGVRITTEAAQVALNKKPYLALAFYFAEKSKSAVLLEAISDASAKSFARIPENLLEEENNIKAAIALCAQKLALKPTTEEEKYLRETSFNLNRSYASFIKKLEIQFPAYFNLKFNTTAPSISQIQSRLNDKTALLSYFTDDKNNKLYIFLITNKKYKVIEHNQPKDFDKYITGFRNSLFFNDLKIYLRSAAVLSEILIPKGIPSSIEELVILPTGRLSIIPFEALLKRKPVKESTYQNLSYLLTQYAIRYEFSAGLILQNTHKQSSITEPSIFLCAPVSFPSKDALAELPGTEAEVRDIANLFSEKKYRSGLFTHQQADEKLIKSGNMENYAYLHFATHGIVDERNPALSRIFLQTDVSSEDGNLFAGEIYNIKLNANLVTLSACQTGLGKISKGEGVIGLSRALVYAGAKNSIVSFWSVADQSTANLMRNFYSKVLSSASHNFSVSLREAKLALIKSENYAAPFYWAPFILIGF